MELTAVFSDCQTTNSAQQLLTRTTSLAGLGDMIGVFAGGYIKYRAAPGNAPFWDDILSAKNAVDCASQVQAAMSVFSYVLNYETPNAVYYDEVAFSVIDSIAI